MVVGVRDHQRSRIQEWARRVLVVCSQICQTMLTDYRKPRERYRKASSYPLSGTCVVHVEAFAGRVPSSLAIPRSRAA